MKVKSLLSSVKLLFKPKVIKASVIKPIYEIHVTVDISKEVFLKNHKNDLKVYKQ